MDVKELSALISEALEDVVNIDVKPKLETGYARLLCDDEDGNHYAIQVLHLDADDGGDELDNDCLS